jgi:DNA-binding NarL/FixJ family response regulator
LKVRILLVDDHEIVRKGIRQGLDDHWEICGEVENGQEAVEKALELKPDLVLMDVSMPVMNGIEATQQIRQLVVPTKILLLSIHDSTEVAKQAQVAGADAYLTKTCAVEQLRNAIITVLNDTRLKTTAYP